MGKFKSHTKPQPEILQRKPSSSQEWTNAAIKSIHARHVIHPRHVEEPTPMVKDAIPFTDRLEAPTNTGWMAGEFTNTRVKPLPDRLINNEHHPIPIVEEE